MVDLKYIYTGLAILFVVGIIYSNPSPHLSSSGGDRVVDNLSGDEVEDSPSEEEPALEVMEFTTDKDVYTSQEEIIVSLEIRSSEKMEQATIKLKGIKPYSRNYIDSSETIDLEKGTNQIIFEEKAPSCTSGCGGVYPGPYELVVEIYSGGSLMINSTKTIELTDH